MNALLYLPRIVSLLFCIYLAGCAGPGPVYQPVAQIPQGRGAVYFYGAQEFVSYAKVQHASTHLVRIDPTLYYVHFPPAGTNYYVVPPMSQGMADWFVDKQSPGVVPIRIEEGKSYYFRVVGFNGIVRVDNETGSREIAQCRLAKGARPDTIGTFKENKQPAPAPPSNRSVTR